MATTHPNGQSGAWARHHRLYRAGGGDSSSNRPHLYSDGEPGPFMAIVMDVRGNR
jgi:hypothetical protein